VRSASFPSSVGREIHTRYPPTAAAGPSLTIAFSVSLSMRGFTLSRLVSGLLRFQPLLPALPAETLPLSCARAFLVIMHYDAATCKREKRCPSDAKARSNKWDPGAAGPLKSTDLACNAKQKSRANKPPLPIPIWFFTEILRGEPAQGLLCGGAGLRQSMKVGLNVGATHLF